MRLVKLLASNSKDGCVAQQPVCLRTQCGQRLTKLVMQFAGDALALIFLGYISRH